MSTKRARGQYQVTGTHEMRIHVDFGDGRETHTFHETREGEEVKTSVMVYTPAE